MNQGYGHTGLGDAKGCFMLYTSQHESGFVALWCLCIYPLVSRISFSLLLRSFRSILGKNSVHFGARRRR